jgi:hypothetical protein
MLDDNRYVSILEVCKFLGIDRHTLHRWLAEYDIKHVKVLAGAKKERHKTLIWKPDLDRFIEEHTVKPEPKPEPKRRGRPPKLQLAKQG